jgi:hypothetical protein
MQLPLTPPLVLAALLTAGPGATDTAPEPAEPSSTVPPAAVAAAVPAAAPSCPAYLGPQCDSVEHAQWASGQALADLARHAHRHAA